MPGTKREAEAEGGFMIQVLARASVLITALLSATLHGTFSRSAEGPLALAAEGLEGVLHTRNSSLDLQTRPEVM